MVLVFFVGVLCYRVYSVVYPTPEERSARPQGPGVELPAENQPPVPAPRPPSDVAQSYAEFSSRNPFRYEATSASGQKTAGATDPGIVLLDIRELNGVPMAQLRVKSTGTEDWHEMNAAFQGYRITSIDLAAGKVTVYVEEFKRSFDLTKSS